MEFDDLIPGFDQGVFSLLIPLGLLSGAALVQRAAKRFQRVSQQHGSGVSACGLTGHEAARRLLKSCGLTDVAVIASRGRDLYHPSNREVQLSMASSMGRSLAALATAAHEVGHAQQFAANRSLYRLRLIGGRCCLGLAVLLLLLSATVMRDQNPGLVLLVLGTLAVVLQVGATLPLERDASRRARELVRKEGLITPDEEAGVDRVLNAAWLTYAARAAKLGIVLLMIAVLTIAWSSRLVPTPADSEAPSLAFPLPSAGPSRAPRFAMLITAIRFIPLVVIGLILLRRSRSYHRGQPSRAQRAFGRNSTALAAYAEGDYATAVRLLDAAIALLPRTASLHFNRGAAFVRMGHRDRALADFDRALALDPKHPEAHRTRGNLWLEKNDYDRALDDFDAAVQQAPTLAAAWRDRGLTLLWRGDYARALADLDEAIRLDSSDAVAFNNRGVVHMKRHELAEASADLHEAVRLDPDLPNPRQHLASMDQIVATTHLGAHPRV